MIRVCLVFLTLSITAFHSSAQGIASKQNDTLVHSYSEIQNGSIKGQVTTTDKTGASYVTVYLKDAGRPTTTDEYGNYVLRNVKAGNYTLRVDMTGLKPQETTVTVRAGESVVVNLMLEVNQQDLEEVIVRSRKSLNETSVAIGKLAIDPMDLPQSIAVIGQGMIREQQALRLSDVIKNVNGVYVTTTRGNVQESFGARGYSLGNNNLFKNGSRINSGAMPEMSSLEKVEVLKGSAAILYGQVAPGGIVNMVTKQPKFKQGGEVSMRIGSYDLYKPYIDFFGPLSSSIAYRINGGYESAGSFRDGVSSERYYVNPSLLFKLGKKTELLTEGDFLYHHFTPDFGLGTLNGTAIPDVPRSRFMGTDWQYTKTKQSTATATLKHRFSDDWNINTSLAYQVYDRDNYGVERIQASANGDWTRPLGKTLTNEKYYSSQVNLIGKFNSKSLEHNLLAGADADHYLTSNHDFTFPAVQGLPAGSYDKINILDPGKYVRRTDMPVATNIRERLAPVNRVGVYVQDLLKISAKLNILAGIRWSYLQTKGIDSTNQLTGAKTTGKTRYDDAFSPRLGIVFKPSDYTSVFASYSNSFNVNTGQDVDGNTMEPSLINQYELGVKNELFNGLVSANITAYRIINNNLAQTAPYLKDGITANNNTNIKMLSGETTSDGVELDLAAHPLQGFDLTAGYSYNYMRYTKTDTTAGSFKTGERLVNNPAHTANFTAFYTVMNGKLKGFKGGLMVLHIGERVGGWNSDVVKQNKAPFTYRSRLFDVKGFTTVDVSAGYSFKKISLLARVSNLTNTLNYYVHENYSINPLPPTQFTGTVSYRF